jgi:hypothetical protein
MPSIVISAILNRRLGVDARAPKGKFETWGQFAVMGLGIGLTVVLGPVAHAAPIVRLLATQVLNVAFQGALVGLGLKEFLKMKSAAEEPDSPDMTPPSSSGIAELVPKNTGRSVARAGVVLTGLGALAPAAQAFTGGSTAGAATSLYTIGVWAVGLTAAGLAIYGTHLWAQRHLPRYNSLFGTNA